MNLMWKNIIVNIFIYLTNPVVDALCCQPAHKGEVKNWWKNMFTSRNGIGLEGRISRFGDDGQHIHPLLQGVFAPFWKRLNGMEQLLYPQIEKPYPKGQGPQNAEVDKCQNIWGMPIFMALITIILFEYL
jgi:hypothetical protein